jgi:hypothetical protein
MVKQRRPCGGGVCEHTFRVARGGVDGSAECVWSVCTVSKAQGHPRGGGQNDDGHPTNRLVLYLPGMGCKVEKLAPSCICDRFGLETNLHLFKSR